jgi:hypothetical protein
MALQHKIFAFSLESSEMDKLQVFDVSIQSSSTH